MQHVIPVGDFREHEPAANCWCGPTEQEGVTVHNAADHREDYEHAGPTGRPWAIIEEPPFES